MAVHYEWDIETWGEEECIDHDHRDRLHDFGGEELTLAVAEDNGLRLVLVRDDNNGRSWAYVIDGELAPEFVDAYDRPVAKVPKRFHQEFNL